MPQPKQQPEDIGSRGSLLSKIPRIWWKGPTWIAENKKWPDQPILNDSKKSRKETKVIQNKVTAAVKRNHFFDLLIHKYELHKVLRVSAWVTRNIGNCQKIRKEGL